MRENWFENAVCKTVGISCGFQHVNLVSCYITGAPKEGPIKPNGPLYVYTNESDCHRMALQGWTTKCSVKSEIRIYRERDNKISINAVISI